MIKRIITMNDNLKLYSFSSGSSVVAHSSSAGTKPFFLKNNFLFKLFTVISANNFCLTETLPRVEQCY